MIDNLLFLAQQNPVFVISAVVLLLGFWLFAASLRQHKNEMRLHDFNLKVKNDQNTAKKSAFDTIAEVINAAFSNDPKELKRKFLSAGLYDPRWTKVYVPIKYGSLFIGLSLIIVLELIADQPMTTIVTHSALWMIVALILPDAYLGFKARELTYAISGRLPYLLDLMAVCVQTGMTIEASIRYLAKEMEAFDKDIAYLLKKVNDRATLVGIGVALEEMYERVPSNEMRSFVMTLNQSLHYGSSIYSVLSTLSADIREVQMLTIEEKIGKLAAKMSVPLILFIMMPIVILVAAPGVMRMMANV
jgi:tight adherence protein C